MKTTDMIERRDWYVYALAHPRHGLFYIGKGKNFRLYAHEEWAAVLKEPRTVKEEILKDIQAKNEEPTRFVVSHGLLEDEAWELESILIAFTKRMQTFDLKPNLANIASGHHSGAYMLLDKEVGFLNPEIADFKGKRLLLLSINSTYDRDFDYGKGLPGHVAGSWALSKPQAEACSYVLACAAGQIVGVYTFDKWIKGAKPAEPGKRQRYRFEGRPACDEFATSIVGKRLPDSEGFGRGNPVRYSGLVDVTEIES